MIAALVLLGLTGGAALPSPALPGAAPSARAPHGAAISEAASPGPTVSGTTFVVQPGTRVVIELREGDIEVVGGAGREATVLLEGEPGAVRISRSGEAILIGPGRRWGDDGGDLHVRLPGDVHVEVQGIEGDVRVTGVEGDVAVETIDGDVEIRGARRATAQSVDGDLSVEDVDGAAEVHSGDGDVWLTRVRGPVAATTVDGDVQVVQGASRSVTISTVSGDARYDGRVYPDGEYRLATHDGDVTFALEQGVGATLSVSTFEGALRPSFPVEFRGGGLRMSELTIGDGAARVVLETFDGDVHLIRPGERSPGRP